MAGKNNERHAERDRKECLGFSLGEWYFSWVALSSHFSHSEGSAPTLSETKRECAYATRRLVVFLAFSPAPNNQLLSFFFLFFLFFCFFPSRSATVEPLINRPWAWNKLRNISWRAETDAGANVSSERERGIRKSLLHCCLSAPPPCTLASRMCLPSWYGNWTLILATV